LVSSDKTLPFSTSDHLEALSRGLALLRAGKFLEAHEVFEFAWRATCPPLRTRFHGLAQLAASYHQLTLGRARASVRTWQKARAKLASVGALTAPFARDVDALHARLGITVDGPRFIALSELAALQSLPVPEDQTPSP
jgi:hypothetical protein